MRRLRFAVILVAIGACTALVAGCGGSDPDEAKTPANAPTITNGKPPAADAEGGGGGAEGDVAAGKTAFEGACQSCHAAGGTQAAAGPVLADRGLAVEAVRGQIVNGGGGMPANLVQGADLDNVVAFVASLQGDTAEAPPPASGGGGGDDAAVTAGKTFFEGACQGCHLAGGTQAGPGPVLVGKGLAEDAITNQIVNGGGGMPSGLAKGDDLENVTKFVLSLQ